MASKNAGHAGGARGNTNRTSNMLPAKKRQLPAKAAKLPGKENMQSKKATKIGNHS
jgi:hypothetical protein